MNVFICHAAEQEDVGEGIELALRGEGHSIFLDRFALPAGESYNDRIRAAIGESDLFLFLISPEAVAPGRYTLAELDFARERWPHPSGHVLPVMVTPTKLDTIPHYLRAVTILEPRGNVAASVVAAVARVARPWWWRALRGRVALAALVALIGVAGAGWWGYQRIATQPQISPLLRAGDVEREAGNYAQAWDIYARAQSLSLNRRDVEASQERLAMEWLENIRVTVGKDTFTGIVERVRPVLSRCAVGPVAARAGDCLAHLGWGDFLRSREGAGGVDPVRYYQRALAVDPNNPYARAMWGFHILQGGGSVAEARALFDSALASERERDYVRRLQISGLLYRRDHAREEEVMRVANGMRVGNQATPAGFQSGADPWRLWSIYHDRVVRERAKADFLAALPAEDHVATFRWLFPEHSVPTDRRNAFRFVLASFQEVAGQRAEALAGFRALQVVLAGEGLRDGPLVDGTARAIARLSP